MLKKLFLCCCYCLLRTRTLVFVLYIRSRHIHKHSKNLEKDAYIFCSQAREAIFFFFGKKMHMNIQPCLSFAYIRKQHAIIRKQLKMRTMQKYNTVFVEVLFRVLYRTRPKYRHCKNSKEAWQTSRKVYRIRDPMIFFKQRIRMRQNVGTVCNNPYANCKI